MRDRTFIAEIDPNELICRMLEGAKGDDRPPGMSARELVERLDPETRGSLQQMARAAAEYITSCIGAAQPVDP
jgi:hypothetical protein